MLNLSFSNKNNFVFPNDLSKMNLKGNVKELNIRFDKCITPEQTKHHSIFGFEEDERNWYKDFHFDSRGLLREEVQYSSDVLIEWRRYYNYDDQNRLIEEIVHGLFKHTEKYNYKSFINRIRVSKQGDKHYVRKIKLKNGKIIIDFFCPDITKNYYRKCKYENGKLIEKDDWFGRQILRYDCNNNLIECLTSYLSKNQPQSIEKYEYDQNQRLICCRHYNMKDIQISQDLYEYDLHGNWNKKSTTNTNDENKINVFRSISYFDNY